MFQFLLNILWIQNRKNKESIKKDIFAGLSVSFILIPQSMAYAQLAGLPIEVWLYTAFIPVIVASLFWSSPRMSTWPVTIVSLMTATALAPVASADVSWYIAYASLLAFFIGLFYLFIWSLRLWVIVDFLSHPVIVWFTNAAAILTITSQLAKIFWVAYEKWWFYPISLYQLWGEILSSSHIPTLVCWIGSILFLYWVGRISHKIPKVLLLLVLSILLSYLFWYNEVYDWAIVKTIPDTLPFLSTHFLNVWFQTEFQEILRLALFWVIIGLIWFTESISVAKFVSYTTKQPLSPNKELIGQWLANLSSSFFGGYGVAGSFSKTAVNLKSGATSALSWIVSGVMVWITLLFFTPYLYYLPIATLAAIIIVAVSHMIRFQPLHTAWKIEKHDAIIGYITFFTTLVAVPNIEIGVLVWVLLSLILFIYRSMRPKVTEVWLYQDGTYRDVDLFGLKTSLHIWVYRFDGNLYFANAWYFESSILNHISNKKSIRYIILDLEWVNNIDSSGEEVLRNLTGQLKSNNIKVYITGIRTRVFEKLTLSGFLYEFSKKRVFLSIPEALKHIQEKSDKKVNLKPLLTYKQDKDKSPELEEAIIKKIEKIWD